MGVAHLSSHTEPPLFEGDSLRSFRVGVSKCAGSERCVDPPTTSLGNKRRCEPVVNYETIEEMNKYIVKTTRPAHSSLTGSHCSGTISIHIRRATLLAVTLGATAVLAAGCSSTGTGFKAALISPVPVNQQAAAFENGNSSQPSRSPGFDSDLFGG